MFNRTALPALWRPLLALFFAISVVTASLPVSIAQDTVTGAFEGTVTSSDTGEPVTGAAVQIINGVTGQVFPKTSDSRGRFYQGLLQPGIYTIRVSAPGFQPKEVIQRLFITKTGEVIPVPVSLDPAPPGPPSPTPVVASAPQPGAAASPNVITEDETDVRARINASDARQGGAFTEEEVAALPLGSATFTRSFDELTMLLPGVAPPPQTLGSVAGPGVGSGVGSAGQFAVNGLRSRANNFTVDGSDNNDEDIGVRRQGFVALIPQSIESIKEYQAITLLAPAQFGRNIGAQVNAVSKSGGQQTHGTLYGLFNSSQFNTRNFFDTTLGNTVVPLRVGNQAVLVTDRINPLTFGPDLTRARPITVQNFSGGEDSFTLGQAGFVLGGPLEPERGRERPSRMFYFISAEGYIQNAVREESFAVPTVEQRGAYGTGATGFFSDPLSMNFNSLFAFPTTAGGDAVFSLFPFPNNPQGAYGPNTLTQVLPNSAQGKVLSGKFDANFKLFRRQHSLTNRYNFTDDWRHIPAVGGALFSTLQPRVRTQNNSFFLNTELSDPNSSRPVFNQVRLSYGRTRLNFQEERDRTFQSENTLLPGTPFLLNAPLLENFTLPARIGPTTFGPNTGPVVYLADPDVTVQNAMAFGPAGFVNRLGAVGQVNVAGFSPVGVDVFNFPQRRVNNTYQVADELTLRAGRHTYVFGVDARRSELNSELPRISRPLLTFSGSPEIRLQPAQGGGFDVSLTGNFIRPETLVAASAPSGFFQTLAMSGESGINLRYYQLNFYGQDTWRWRPTLALSYGLRYEYNTPPRETNNRIEDTFDDPALNLVPGIREFIGDRTQIFDPDRNNFAPRVGIAYSPDFFGRDRYATVIRAGYGLFYDQILGAVVSQSRNVYPTYLTVNFAGGVSNLAFLQGGAPANLRCPQSGCPLQLINPSNPIPNLSNPGSGGVRLVQPGTLNTVNPNLSLPQVINLINAIVRGGGDIIPPVSGFGATIPEQNLETPLAHHFSFTVDQQLGRNLALSASYVGTRGRHLLRFNTPNLGPNSYVALRGPNFESTSVLSGGVEFFGLTLPPGVRLDGSDNLIITGRPEPEAGTIYRYESTASSDYDALQLQMRTRLRHMLQMQASYTFSKAEDDVSDVFDLAGASALPQNSLNLSAERGPANFDVRHRFASNFIYDFPTFNHRGAVFRALFGGMQIAGLGSFQTGQPFTVNSTFDVNLDGNLTDRLDSTNGLIRTGDRRQPLRLTVDPTTLLAPLGRDGSVGRNSFRAGNFLEIELAFIKSFRLTESQSVNLRADIFNLTNRANYGIPVRFLEAPGFGQSVNTVTPGRRVQFALKYSF